MAYPDELLVEGERVVLHTRPHWKMLVLPVLVFLVMVGAGSFLAALVSAQSWALVARVGLAVVGAVLVGRFTVLPFVRWRTTHFVVTTRRVLSRRAPHSVKWQGVIGPTRLREVVVHDQGHHLPRHAEPSKADHGP